MLVGGCQDPPGGAPGPFEAVDSQTCCANVAIFKPEVLSKPRINCQLAYRLDGNQTVVEKEPGVAWLTMAVPMW